MNGTERHSPMEIGVLGYLRKEENFFRIMAEYGVKTAQLQNWNMDLLTPELAEKVRKDSLESGVRIAAFWAGYSGKVIWNSMYGPATCGLVPAHLRERRVEDLKRGADFAKWIGAPAIITHCGFIPENPSDPEYPRVLCAIYDVAEYCEKLGLGFWFETGQETPVTLLRTIEEVGLLNLGINLDTANLILYGRGNPVDALEIFGKYVRNLHVKDAAFVQSGVKAGREVPIGEGAVDFRRIIRRLYELDFRGELIIEREISGPEQARDILKAKRYLEELLLSCREEGTIRT